MTTSTDVVVVGDGPAGRALARACVDRGVDVCLVGEDRPWVATYGVWLDDLDRVVLLGGADVVSSRHPDVVARTSRQHVLGRTYGVVDNAALRTALQPGDAHRIGVVAGVDAGRDRHRVRLESGSSIDCRLVVDATGWPATFASATLADRPPAWQTAFGVVMPEPPAGDLGIPTLMDFRPSGRASARRSPSTFVYSLPVADGWLVEETVLVGRPAVEPVALVDGLAARLGTTPEALLAGAVRTEYVRIPMGGARPDRRQPVVGFGAAAGFVNPTSGYSVVQSLLVAPRVADAIAGVVDGAPAGRMAPSGPVWDAVWPLPARRTRVLHEYGLEMLMRLDEGAVRAFFAAFFDLPTETWAAYMRAETPPREVAAVMARLFRSAPMAVRRRLVAGNPLAFARLIRPR